MAKDKENKNPETKQKEAPLEAQPVKIHAQYIRDLSVENPQAPQTLVPSQEPPQTSVSVAVDMRKVQMEGIGEIYEVSLGMSVKTQQGNLTPILIELEYATACSVLSIPKDKIHYFMHTEIPRLMFPFVRQIIADLTAHSGYNPLYLTPVNFYALYVQRFGTEFPRKEDIAEEPKEASA